MVAVVGDYFRVLLERFGQAWNRFWFLPSDALTLSVIRVLTGLLAFYTILTYTPDLGLFFGADGLLESGITAELRGTGDYFSLSYLNLLHTPGALLAGHLAGLLVLALFTVGLFTRVTSVLALVVVLSYYHRSWVITGEMEAVLAFVLFYLCLAPAGNYLSLDRILAQRKRSQTVASGTPAAAHWSTTVATRLIQVHLAIVYGMMLLSQLNQNTWWDGTAIWWLAGRYDSSLTDLTWLHQHPWVVNAWTHGFVLFELAFLTLAWNRLAAPLLIALSIITWGLMAIVTGLVPLAVMMVVAGLAFLAPESGARWPIVAVWRGT